MTPRTTKITAHDILNADEIDQVVSDMRRKSRRSQRALVNLGVFRALLGCGLRASEAAGLRIRDVVLTGSRPHLFVRAETTKGVRSKNGKTTWSNRDAFIFSSSILDDLQKVLDMRLEMGAGPDDPFFCSTDKGSIGNPLTRFQVRKRFIVACRCLDRQVTSHTGRHTFASWLLGIGKSPAVVAASGGWHNQNVLLSTYSHVWEDASASSWMVD